MSSAKPEEAGRRSDSGSLNFGESPHHRIKKSLFKFQVFKQTFVGLGI